MLRRRLLAVLLVVSLFGAALPAFAQDDAATCDAVLLVDGWVRATMPGMPNSAGYGLLVNLSGEADTLVGAVTDAASVVELHEMTMAEGDVMQMRPLADGIDVPPGEFVTLEPGGLHIMMIDLQRVLEPGDTVDFTLTFARNWRMSSIPRLDAPSISSTSTSCPAEMLWQMSQSLQGTPSCTFGQFSALAKMRAVDVLPTPRAPVNRYA